VKHWQNDLSLNGTSAAKKLGITSVSILNDSNSVVSCCQDSTVQIHNIRDMSLSESIQPGLLEAWTICTSPNDMLAGGSQSGAVNLWSLQNRRKVNSFVAGNKLIADTAFSPHGDKLAAVGVDGVLSVFDIQSEKCLLQAEAHALPARQVTFSPDGNLIYTASVDRHVNIFDVGQQVAVSSFSHGGMALSVDVSPDNRRFVSSCSNHSVHIWDIGMQRCLQSFDTQHSDQVWGVCFNATGDKFVSVGDDSSMQLYENASSK